MKIINSYHNNGIFLANNVFDIRSVNLALTGACNVKKEIFNTNIPPWGIINLQKEDELQRITQSHIADSNILKLLTSSKLGKVAAKLTGSTQIKVWGTQLYIKPKNSPNSIVGFHTDHQHMPYFSSGVLTAWIPLTKIEPEAGPLLYMKGSHRYNQEFSCAGAQIQGIEEQRKMLISESKGRDWQEYQVDIPLGSVCFHHRRILHGSVGNNTNFDRYALAVGLLTDQATFDKSKNDYGYAKHLDNEKICPIIYK